MYLRIKPSYFQLMTLLKVIFLNFLPIISITLWTKNKMEGDHIKLWSKGGKTEKENLQMLCKHHNSMKSNN